MPPKSPDRFLNFAEVATMLGLHWTTVRDGKCGTNEIPRIKLSNKAVRFSLNAVQAWMERKAQEAEEVQQRERRTVIDLMSRQRRQAVKSLAQSIVEQERRRGER